MQNEIENLNSLSIKVKNLEKDQKEPAEMKKDNEPSRPHAEALF